MIHQFESRYFQIGKARWVPAQIEAQSDSRLENRAKDLDESQYIVANAKAGDTEVPAVKAKQAASQLEQHPEVPPHGNEQPEGAVLSDVLQMKKYYKDYNPDTALRILEAIPLAWKTYVRDSGRWGPGLIAPYADVEATTVGRYLKAFRSAAIVEWKGVPLP